MKSIRLLIAAFFLLTAFGKINAQTLLAEANGKQLLNDSTAKLTAFSAKYNTGKVYLKWTVMNQREDGLYLVYRSADGINFENIGSKPGIGVPISKEIAYYFTDNAPVSGSVQYKIIHIGHNKMYLSSDNVFVCTDSQELVSK
jgi:hypothetical protein